MATNHKKIKPRGGGLSTWDDDSRKQEIKKSYVVTPTQVGVQWKSLLALDTGVRRYDASTNKKSTTLQLVVIPAQAGINLK